MSEGDWIEDEKPVEKNGGDLIQERYGKEGFDADAQKPLAPADVYRLRIVRFKKIEKSDNNKMMILEYQIIEPSGFEHFPISDVLCLIHPNATTQRIAEERLRSISRACGTRIVRESDFAEKEFIGTVGVKPGKSGELQNFVKIFHDASKPTPPITDGIDPFGM